MTKAITFLFMSFMLLSCVRPHSVEQVVRLSAAEFRAAAEGRVSWRDPELPLDAIDTTWIKAKILGFNDFHGNLNPLWVGGRPAGGAAVLASYLEAEAREVNDRAIIVHAGDLVGASPPVSALLQDEPTMQFLNILANDDCKMSDFMAPTCNVVGTLGNHEFDDGRDEIIRLLYGGQYDVTSGNQREWAGVKVPYVSANIRVSETGKTFLPPYVIKEIAGVKVAFIGAVLKDTPKIVIPSGVEGLEFIDEAAAINGYVAELKAKNVHAIVVAIHQGLRQSTFGADSIVGQGDLQGEIIDIVEALDDDVDIVISAHAHGYTNVLVPNKDGKKILLTQAFSYGTAYGDIDITLDPASGDIIEKAASIVSTWDDAGPGLSPDPEITEMVAKANIAVKPMVSRVVGHAAIDIIRGQNEAGESALGNLIADSHRIGMGTDFAFAGSGGIRGNISAGEILWGNLFTIKPFGNDVVVMTLSGEQIARLLNQQKMDEDSGEILQISGLQFTWDVTRDDGDRIVKIVDGSTGKPINPHASYTVAVDSFLAGGGSGFTVLKAGSNRVIGPLSLEVLIDYIKAQARPIEAHIEGRITRLN